MLVSFQLRRESDNEVITGLGDNKMTNWTPRLLLPWVGSWLKVLRQSGFNPMRKKAGFAQERFENFAGNSLNFFTVLHWFEIPVAFPPEIPSSLSH